MKILIEGSLLDTNQGTGIFRYINNLLNYWSAHDDPNEYTIVSRTPVILSVKNDSRFRFKTLPPKLNNKIFVWQNLDLPLYFKREKFDVLFFPTYFIPFWGLRAPLVTVIYDVYYLAHPEWVPALKYELMKFGTNQAAKHSKAIICGSEYDKGQIVKYLNVLPDKVKVIYGVASEKFKKQTPNPDFRGKYKLKNGRVISCVGILFNRRHQDIVVKAFDSLADKEGDIQLLLLGKNATYPYIDFEDIISKCRNKDRISYINYMPEEDMLDLYNSSEAVVYLSSHEGESFPLREALACEVPCLTTPILREVCEDAAVYVEDPKDINCVERGMSDLLNRRAELSGIAAKMKSDRSWKDMAMETLLCIKEAARK